MSWSTPTNWLNGVVPGNGGVATFVDVPLTGNESAGVVQNVPGLTLSRLTFNSTSPYFFNVSSNAITLTGAAVIDTPLPGFRAFDSVPLGHVIQVPFAGSSGLTKTGPGTVALTASSTYTGGTFINGGIVIARRGDATFGAAGGPISIGDATLRIQDNSFTTTRPLHLTGNATLDNITTTAISGAIDGQSLTKRGYGDLSLSAANNPYTGATNLLAGSTTISGAIPNSSSILVRGDLSFTAVTNPINRINDAALLAMQGGTLSIAGATTVDVVETVGDASFAGGTSSIAVDAQPNRTTTLALGNVSRVDRGTAFFFGRNLGIVPSQTAQTKITFAAAPAMVGGGGAAGSTNISVVPWAYAGSQNDAGGVSPLTHATYTANGVRPLALSEYATTIASNTVSTNNVFLKGPLTLNGPATINALRLTRDDITVIGGWPVIDGNDTLTITSGSILNLDSSVFNVPVNFGPAEGVAMSSVNLTFNAPISGSGGFTKQGDGNLHLNSNESTYTGQTTLSAATRRPSC